MIRFSGIQGRQSLARVLISLLFLLAASLEAQTPNIGKPIVHPKVTPKTSEQDLRTKSRQVAAVRLWSPGDPVREVEDMKRQDEPQPGAATPSAGSVAAALETAGLGAAATASPLSFDGIPATIWTPPDPAGDVGPHHYVQAVNSSFAIYDKQGNLLVGPAPINIFWAGVGGACETSFPESFDPIVRYDQLADRWLISFFASHAGLQCVAISRTSDPVAGGWYLYDFPTPDVPDYPKIGVWPDGYYMGTQRSFPGGGLDVYAFERAKMLNGLPAGQVQFFVPAPSLFLLPSDLDGPAPPAGTPNFFVRLVDGDQFGGVDRLELFAFDVDWTTPASSTFTPLPPLQTAPFNAIFCGDNFFGSCVPQPGTGRRLETLPAWMMWRLQYRNFGTHETLVTNHSVNVGSDHAGIRWYELRRTPGGGWAIFQQGTYSPDEGAPGPADDVHRWMASMAMNRDGCSALGYSVASSTVFPGIRYTGRRADDPAGTLPVAEVTLVDGGGSQTGSIRWGNYSTLDVDPVDDRTFWYTTEYYSATSSSGWRTRISSFQLPDCGPAAPKSLPHRVGFFVGGLFTDGSLPLSPGLHTGFRYQRHRFLPNWSWEAEASLAFTDDGIDDGLLGNAEFHLVRHLRPAPPKVQPFLLVGVGGSHFNRLGFSDTAFLATVGSGVDFRWKPKVGFRVDLKVLWLNDMIDPGWTTNVQASWGPTFSF